MAEHFVTSAALRALGRIAPKSGDTFTRTALRAAMGEAPRSSTQKLLSLGFATYRRMVQGSTVVTVYTLTEEGAAAVAAALGGKVLKNERTCTRQPARGTLPQRLWALMRNRKVLDAPSAANLLCDAGDAAYQDVRRRCSEHLRRWHCAGAIELSKAQLAQNAKRYVLINDPGPAVPQWPEKRARRKAA